MTDKIIIDDVDVSGCLFYQTNFEEDYDVKIKHYCSNWHNSCESNNNSNCYYKQLKRKEQELADLKEFCEKLKKSNSNYATAVLKRNLKLKKIKYIATDLLSLTNEFDNCYHKDKCNKCDKVCQYRFVDKILQIVEGENNV